MYLQNTAIAIGVYYLTRTRIKSKLIDRLLRLCNYSFLRRRRQQTLRIVERSSSFFITGGNKHQWL